MRENNPHNPQGNSSERRYSCEVYHLFGGTPCAKAAKENVDGLVFCERHALRGQAGRADRVLGGDALSHRLVVEGGGPSRPGRCRRAP